VLMLLGIERKPPRTSVEQIRQLVIVRKNFLTAIVGESIEWRGIESVQNEIVQAKISKVKLSRVIFSIVKVRERFPFFCSRDGECSS